MAVCGISVESGFPAIAALLRGYKHVTPLGSGAGPEPVPEEVAFQVVCILEKHRYQSCRYQSGPLVGQNPAPPEMWVLGSFR